MDGKKNETFRRFFDLPLEVRNIVYNELVANDPGCLYRRTNIVYKDKEEPYFHHRYNGFAAPPKVPMLRANKQIYGEGKVILYKAYPWILETIRWRYLMKALGRKSKPVLPGKLRRLPRFPIFILDDNYQVILRESHYIDLTYLQIIRHTCQLIERTVSFERPQMALDLKEALLHRSVSIRGIDHAPRFKTGQGISMMLATPQWHADELFDRIRAVKRVGDELIMSDQFRSMLDSYGAAINYGDWVESYPLFRQPPTINRGLDRLQYLIRHGIEVRWASVEAVDRRSEVRRIGSL